jgi:multidrug resistance efflux pump
MDDQQVHHATAKPLSLTDRVRSLRLPADLERGKARSSSRLPWLLCVAFAGLSGYQFYRSSATETSAPETTVSVRPALSTESKPNPPKSRIALEAGGYVIPVHRVQVSPKVGGQVVGLFIEEGQYVKKDAVLARLDPEKYGFEYRRTVAQAEQAKAEYDKMLNGMREEEKKQAAASLREAEELRDQADDEAKRARNSRHAVSAEEMVRITSRLTQAKHKVEQLLQVHRMMQEGPRKEEIEKAKAAYLLACAQRDNAKYDLDNTEVRAPISGRILKKQAEVGNTVRPEAYSNGLSASLCEMADVRDLEVDVDVSERDLDRIFTGQVCEIRTEAFPNRVYRGHVARLMPEANRSKASVSARVHVEVPEGDEIVRPEMRARVTFLSREANGRADRSGEPRP